MKDGDGTLVYVFVSFWKRKKEVSSNICCMSLHGLLMHMRWWCYPMLSLEVKWKKKYIKDFFHLVDDNKTCGTCTLLNNFTHAHTHTQTLRHTQMRCMLSKLLFHSLSDMQCEPDVGGGGYPPDFSNYRLQCGFVKRKCKTLCHSNIKMKQKKVTYPPLSSVQSFVFSLLKSNF